MPSLNGDTSVIQNLLNYDCSFDVKQRLPCDRLYRLISVEEKDGTVTMVLELMEEKTSVIGMGKDAWAKLRQVAEANGA